MHIDIPLIQLINQGVNITQYRTLLVKQFNQATQHIECPVCQANLNNNKVKKVIDHNHTTGKVRGVLCSTCNSSVGMLKENPDIIKQAIVYLSIDFSNNITYQSVRKRKQLAQVYEDLVKQRMRYYLLVCSRYFIMFARLCLFSFIKPNEILQVEHNKSLMLPSLWLWSIANLLLFAWLSFPHILLFLILRELCLLYTCRILAYLLLQFSY